MKSDKEMVKRNYCGVVQGMPVYMESWGNVQKPVVAGLNETWTFNVPVSKNVIQNENETHW